MLLSSATQAEMPACVPLEQSPLWAVPLDEPPRAAWLGVGRHGRWAREDYRLPGLWCVHLYRWTGVLRVVTSDGGGSIAVPIRPGYASLVPPDTPLSHFFRTGGPPSVHLSAGFALLTSGGGTTGPLAPLMQDLSDDFGRLNGLFEEAVAFYATSPRRAEARLWEILWQIASRAAPIGARAAADTGGEHEAVTRAREIIELRLGEPLRVAEVARAVDLSNNHLTRLFHAATGQSVVAYIRERRIAHARRLLQHTTLPIKNVAAQVGLPDPHQFNKAVRQATGLSPRALRRHTDGPADKQKAGGH
jgi:AraC-like DNA-binding protein